MRSTQTLVNTGLYWIEGFSNEGIVLHLFIVFLKELNIPPLQAKYMIAQVRCFFKKWKNSKCIISNLLRDISRHAWDKERKILSDKLDKFPSKKKKKANCKTFTEIEIWRENQSRLRLTRKNEFEKTRDYLNFNFRYPEFSIGFRCVLHARCGHKFDIRVAKAANRIEDDCTEWCPCGCRKKQ